MMKIHNKTCIGVMVWILLCFTNTGTAAETDDSDSFYSGKVVFIPSIEAFYTYDSNYYKEAVQEVSINSYVIKPGFKSGYKTPKSQVIFDYFLTANDYSGDERVEDDDYYGHDLTLSAQTQATQHLLLGIEESYIKSRVTGSLDDLGNEVSREKYEMNVLSPYLDYAFNDRWGMGVRYTNTTMDYDENLSEGSDGHQGDLDLKYHLDPTSLIKMEYNIWNRNYDRATPTYTSQQLTLAYEKEYRFFFLNAGAGYHDRQFDGAGEDDFDAFVWSISMNGEAAKARYFLSLDRNFNNFGEGQQYYSGLSLYAVFGYLFVDKLDLELTFEFQDRDYENKTREDEIYQLTGQLGYLLTKHFSMAVKYGYEQRDSTRADSEYDNSYLMLSAKLEYDVSGR